MKTIAIVRLGLFAAPLWAPVPIGIAATVTVDCDSGESVSSALARLKPGDAITVSGTCNEHVTVPAELQRITLDDQGRATINAPATAAVAVAVTGREIAIRRFTITGGRNGIVVARGASALIEGNTIQNTGVGRQPGSGLGINVAQHSYAAIIGNTIQHNRVIGILVHENSSARIGFADVAATGMSNVIQNNGSHGIAMQRGATARIVGATFDATCIDRLSR